MIPKIIHYCWFGNGEKPENITKIMESWSKLEGFKVIEWNESNINIDEHPYLKKSYESKKYAFVSDYVRLKVLYKYGGIYLDTDVEIKKNFDESILNESMFLSFMYNCNLSTAIIGAQKENKIIKELLNLYDDLELNYSPNNDVFTNYMLDKFEDFKLNNSMQLLDNEVKIYPKEYFECPSFIKGKTYSVHQFTSTWKEKNKTKEAIKKFIKIVVGDLIYHKYTRYKAIKKSPFYDRYVTDTKSVKKYPSGDRYTIDIKDAS